MTILWLLAEHRFPRDSVGASLQGDFALRRFSSWNNFKCLTHNCVKVSPDAILTDLTFFDAEVHEVDAFIMHRYAPALRVYLCHSEDLIELNQGGRFLFSTNIDPFQLSSRMANLLRLHQNQYTLLVYRDIHFDPELLTMKIEPDDSEEGLSLKEGQLLKYFLNHPKRCIQRSELIEKVWRKVKVSPRTIDSRVSKLRKRIERSQASIESVYGGGYILS